MQQSKCQSGDHNLRELTVTRAREFGHQKSPKQYFFTESRSDSNEKPSYEVKSGREKRSGHRDVREAQYPKIVSD